MQWFRRAGLILLALLIVGIGYLKIFHGGGKPYPNQSTSPLIPESALKTLVEMDFPPGNVAVTAEGRIFINYHPFAKAKRFSEATVFELVDGKLKPFPDQAFQSKYQGVFGMTVDRQGVLWMTEPASLDFERSRLLAFDLSNDKLVLEHWFEKGVARFAQDLRVSPDGTAVVLADTGLFKFSRASLIVFDVKTKRHRTVLAGHPALQPQDWLIQTEKGPQRLGYGLVSFSVGIDGIEFSPDGQLFYFGAMSHNTLYRLPSEALLDAKAGDVAVAAKLTEVGRKPLSDGITVDKQGNILITDIEHGGIARMSPNGVLLTLISKKDISWADGIVLSSDGKVLFTDSAIPRYIDQLARPPSKQALAVGKPYRVYSFQLP